MQVRTLEPGHALCQGRGPERRINTALVGTLVPGDWVLVFMESAQELLSQQRAQEINATLDLMDAALKGEPHNLAVGFSLPSAMSQTQLVALCGAPSLNSLETP